MLLLLALKMRMQQIIFTESNKQSDISRRTKDNAAAAGGSACRRSTSVIFCQKFDVLYVRLQKFDPDGVSEESI
jgi:hypothetical protein